MAPSDFVNAKLSARGAELAGEGSVRVHGGTYEFSLAPGQTLRVTRGEFNEILLRAADEEGKSLFEETEDSAGESPAVPPRRRAAAERS
ncbi:MAG: hypothetical protein LAN84_15515 [Acidobacteriia bacterium]|nr:hypothetical protein [Terriglobia bacterium]